MMSLVCRHPTCAFGYNFDSLEDANNRVLGAYKITNQRSDVFSKVSSMYIPGFHKWPLPHLIKKREATRILFEKVERPSPS
ncbi:unnamed protein product, partial [Aphanomyces euteiches]